MIASLIVIAVLVLVGFLLLVFGLWPPREGNDPYCWNCSYNLTGLSRETCPECGYPITEHRIVYGRRRRRPGRIVLGVLCMLPALLVVVGLIARLDFYQHIPAGWVINDLGSQDSNLVMKAWSELDRRRKANELSGQQESKVIDVCLSGQAHARGTVSDPLPKLMVGYLGDAYLGQKMSQPQADRFFNQLIRFELEIQPVVAASDLVPYRVRFVEAQGMQWSSATWWYSAETQTLLVDEESVSDEPRWIASCLEDDTLSTRCHSWGDTYTTVYAGPGSHALTVGVHLRVYTGLLSDENASTLHHERRLTLRGEFRQLAPNSDEYVWSVDDPRLLDELHACFEPVDFADCRNSSGGGRNNMLGSIRMKRTLPLGVLFDVSVREGMFPFQTHVGSFYRVQGQAASDVQVGWRRDGPPVDSVDVILTSRRSHPDLSPGVFDTWRGELIYRDVPVRLDPAPQTSPNRDTPTADTAP